MIVSQIKHDSENQNFYEDEFRMFRGVIMRTFQVLGLGYTIVAAQHRGCPV